MEKFTLTVNSNKGPLTVHWTDVGNLAKYSNIQSGYYLQESRDLSKDLLLTHFQNWNQMFWEMRESTGMFDFNPNSTIVDIGSGMSIVDLLLYSYIENSKFYLIDEEGWDDNFATSYPPNVCYSNTYPVYHSWGPVKDAIETSNFDKDRFIMLTSNNFPKDVDVVMSFLSWCFHYPKEKYWDSVMTNLKTGGKLLLDVRLLNDRDVIGEISEEFKCNPITIEFPKPPCHVDTYPAANENHAWSRCVWTKNI